MYSNELLDQINARYRPGSAELNLSHLHMLHWFPEVFDELEVDLSAIKHLDLSNCNFTADALLRLCSSMTWTKLESLNLSTNSDLASKLQDTLLVEQFPGLTKLSLNNLKFEKNCKELGETLKQFSGLEILEVNQCSLSNDQFVDLFPGAFPSIKKLVLSYNKLSDLAIEHIHSTVRPQSLVGLSVAFNDLTVESVLLMSESPLYSGLKDLHIGGNAIGDKGFTLLVDGNDFPELVELSCWNTGLTDAGVMMLDRADARRFIRLIMDSNTLSPKSAAHLSNLPLNSLVELNLSETLISTNGLELILSSENLPNLKILRASACDIEMLPEHVDYGRFEILHFRKNKISSLPGSLRLFPDDGELELSENLFVDDPPPSFIASGNEAIFEYLEQRSEGTVANTRFRLMLLGRHTSGKTTLSKKLLDPDFVPGFELRTSGIDRKDWFLGQTENDGVIELWDFGGQEIQYQCHQYFISPEPSYAVVIDKATSKAEIIQLLHVIATLANLQKERLVRVQPILNLKSSEFGTHNISWDHALYQEGFESVLTLELPITVDLANGKDSPDVKYLFEQLKKFVTSNKQSGLPVKYAIGRKLVAEQAEPMMPYDAFYPICEQQLEFRTNPSFENLVRYLEYMGDVRYFSGMRLLVLNMDWLMKCLYVLFQPNPELKVVDDAGYFNKSQLLNAAEWRDFCNSDRDRQALFEILCRNQLDLVYPLEDGVTYFVPSYLPSLGAQPAWLDEQRELVCVLVFNYIPLGLVTNLIVRFHENLRKNGDVSFHWKDYFELAENENTARVFQRDNCLVFEACESDWSVKQRDALLACASDIVQHFRSCNFDTSVPCPYCWKKDSMSSPANWFDYAILNPDNFDDDTFLRCDVCHQDIALEHLLYGKKADLLPPDDGLWEKHDDISEYIRSVSDSQLIVDVFRIACARKGMSIGDIERITLVDFSESGAVHEVNLNKATVKRFWQGARRKPKQQPTTRKIYTLNIFLLKEMHEDIMGLFNMQKRDEGLQLAQLQQDVFLAWMKDYFREYLMADARNIIPIQTVGSPGAGRGGRWIKSSTELRESGIDIVEMTDIEKRWLNF